MCESILTTNQLTKKYRNHLALDAIHINIKKETFMASLGRMVQGNLHYYD